MSWLYDAPLRLVAQFRRFGRAREAVAAVEFALILPVMLTMYVGSIELSQAFSMDERIITVAGTVGDLVARTDGSITDATLTNYFQAAQAIMAPYSTTALKQSIAVVQIDSKGTTQVQWSRGYNGGDAPTVCQPYAGNHPIPVSMTNIATSNWVVVSSATYVYPPMLGLFFHNAFTFYHQNFYLPRYAKYIQLNTTVTPCP